jgi:hypothetical protein
MRARFRLQHRRLQISLVHSHRIDGRVHEDHVAALGSIPVPMTVAGRVAFWDKAHDRLARLANRLGQEGYAKIAAEMRAKVPPVTKAERKAEARARFANAVAIVKRTGMTDADIRHAIRTAQLTEEEFQETVAETVRGTLRGYDLASRVATNKILKRRQRSVTSPA